MTPVSDTIMPTTGSWSLAAAAGVAPTPRRTELGAGEPQFDGSSSVRVETGARSIRAAFERPAATDSIETAGTLVGAFRMGLDAVGRDYDGLGSGALGQNAPDGVATLTVASDPVSAAVDTIRDNLSESWTDWDVSHGDLIENNRVLADLTPAQRNEVIRQISDGDLNKWADEIHGALGALSASERQDLFNLLAEGLDAAQLARVVRAFEGHDDSLRELSAAVAAHASQAVRDTLVQELRPTAVQDLVASLPPGPLSAQEYQDISAQFVRDKLPEGQFDNIYARNAAITQAYAEMYFANPDIYKWAGMAAFASDLVGEGIRQAEAGRQSGLPIIPGVSDFSFTDLSRSLQLGNARVYNDIYWQHLAYQHGGIDAIRRAYDERAITQDVLRAWEQIDAGVRTGDPELVWQGNKGLLRYEQEITLQRGVYDPNRHIYQRLSSEIIGLVQPLTSPIPGDAVTFQDFVPGGDIGDFNDRWGWIEDSMLPAWRARESDLMFSLYQFTLDP